MAKNCEVVTVHTMNPVPPRGPVFYASLPRDTEKPESDGATGEEARHHLVSILWDHFAAMENPLWKRGQSFARAAFPIQLVRGLFGRPHLQSGGNRGPAVSFSEGGGRVWAALSGDDADIGIDVAGADEFHDKYPLQRVFHPEELHHALRLAGGNLEEAAALLWSVKEAVVKALGCGFHLVDPRQITVHPSVRDRGGHTFTVGFSGKALERFPLASGSALWVHSLPQRNMWVSFALLNRRPTVRG